MGTAAKPTRANRTITIDFRNEATYFRLLEDGKAFLEFVFAFILSMGFQLTHKATCGGGGCLTRHSHYGVDNLMVRLCSSSSMWHTRPTPAAPRASSALVSYSRVLVGAAMTTSAPIHSYKHHRFPAEIISHGVWLYFRFCLSYRDVEELLFVRGVIVTYEAIRKWCRKFGQAYANQLRRRHPRPGDK
jgi:hypothetical protein